MPQRHKLILDTHVMLKLLARCEEIYERLYNKIIEECHTIIVSREILNEYRGRAHSHGMSLPMLMSLMSELESLKKIRNIEKSRIEAVWRRLRGGSRRIPLPEHSKDIKFVRAAVTIRADYILSEDLDLLDLVEIFINGHTIRICSPHEYLTC